MIFPGRLYAIVDPCGREIDPVRIAADFLEGGARVLQLRWKNANQTDLIRAGREIRHRAAARGALLIVNDDVEAALAAEADGAHVGQDDLSAPAARRRLGERLLGVSTHDLDQARAAQAARADYIGFGPIFETATKDTGFAPRGLEQLREVSRAVTIPIVAIGGIRISRAQACREAGADATAMISELVLADDRIEAVRRAVRTLERDSG